MSHRRSFRISPAVVLAMVAVPALATGCLERQGRPVAPCTNVTIGQAIQVNNVDKVDLLFMVDNSNSMTEEQASLAIEFPRMINILASGDFDQDGSLDGEDDFEPVRDLNVGVITSDMGTGGHTVPTCARSDFGDDGVLRTQGRTDISGCMATYPMFLNFRPADGGSATDFASDVACVANTGTGGCGFEQQLEAILKAGSPTAPTSWTAADYSPPNPGFFRNTFGHGDMANNGFFRENAVLALIPVTDEEDCSAANTDLFNPASMAFGATDLNLRCFVHSAEALHPISRYVEGFINLRSREGLLIYAPIVGIPVDLVAPAGSSPDYDRLVGPAGTRDERMEERVDPAMPTRLVPSCNVPGRGQAFPPVRMVRVAQELEARGAGVTVQSICQESFQGALTEIIRQIKSALGAACLPRQLNLEADGSVACDVLVVMPAGQACSDLPGATEQIVDGAPVSDEGRAVCVLEPLLPDSRAPGSPAPGGAGWYYDNFTTEGQANCQEAVDSPWQRIAFTAQPPSGAEVRLECFQSVQATGEGDITIGTFCDPASDTVCPTGMVPAGGSALSCDPIARTCGVQCANDADCRAAGLVGFVCDTRPLGEVDDGFEGNTDAYNFCSNPTCG
ncbi:MAG: hypothetical protein AB8I08_01075 [Sandaracinaceae bacterium]